jgi:hypothetical protein
MRGSQGVTSAGRFARHTPAGRVPTRRLLPCALQNARRSFPSLTSISVSVMKNLASYTFWKFLWVRLPHASAKLLPVVTSIPDSLSIAVQSCPWRFVGNSSNMGIFRMFPNIWKSTCGRRDTAFPLDSLGLAANCFLYRLRCSSLFQQQRQSTLFWASVKRKR